MVLDCQRDHDTRREWNVYGVVCVPVYGLAVTTWMVMERIVWDWS